MMQKKKDILVQREKTKHHFQRMLFGFSQMFQKKSAFLLALLFLIAMFLMKTPLEQQLYNGIREFDGAFQLAHTIFLPSYIFIVAVGLIVLAIQIGTPKGAERIENDLWRIGLKNHASEAPVLINCKKDEGITIMEFDARGIPLSEWQKNREWIETALNVHIVRLEQGKNKRSIRLHTISGNEGLPSVIWWDDCWLDERDFILILGMGLSGRVMIDFAKIPHVLLGGSTGSGKSVLLKSLLMQCVKKGAEVYIADFKGGVDFSSIWHEKCCFVTSVEPLLEELTSIISELEYRKQTLKNSGYANIQEYNSVADTKLERIIVACDEVSELLDKTGLSKEEKELITKIEGKLSYIARQGRAFGIHLIFATQRPDANILSGQIRNNIDYRVCGRADNVLSQIILDNTDAAVQIPKDEQGLFINHEGTVFRGFLIDEINFDKI